MAEGERNGEKVKVLERYLQKVRMTCQLQCPSETFERNKAELALRVLMDIKYKFKIKSFMNPIWLPIVFMPFEKEF